MATRAPARWSKFLHLTPYRRGNSPQGVKRASRALGGPGAIDLDVQVSLDGALINTHWAHPAREGFLHTEGPRRGKAPLRPFRLLPWSTIATLRTSDGYRVQSVNYALRLAAANDVRVELELKSNPSEAALRALAGHALACYGPSWRQWVQVKELSAFRWRVGLRRAKRAGFITMLLRSRNGDLPSYVNHFRP